MNGLLLALGFFTSSAHALQVGDHANYMAIARGHYEDVVVTVRSISDDTYVTDAISQVTGQHNVFRGKLSDLVKLDTIFANCEANGGSFETVLTKVGSFKTCHVRSDANEAYLSPEVTFGVVKQRSIEFDGMHETILTGF